MKLHLPVSLFVLAAMAALCFSEDAERPEWVMGKWEYKDRTGSVSFDFKRSGEFGLVMTRGGESRKLDGVWVHSPGIIELKPIAAAPGKEHKIAPAADKKKMKLTGGIFGDSTIDLAKTADAAKPAAAAGEKPKGDPGPLLGSWFSGDREASVLYVFSGNGKFHSELMADGYVLKKDAKFWVEGNEVVVKEQFGDPERSAFQIKADKLTIHLDDMTTVLTRRNSPR